MPKENAETKDAPDGRASAYSPFSLKILYVFSERRVASTLNSSDGPLPRPVGSTVVKVLSLTVLVDRSRRVPPD